MIWREPIHKSRQQEMWLAEWMYPHGIAQTILEKIRTDPIQPSEEILQGRLLLVPKKKESVVVDALAALANHADMADCLPGSQALTWLRTGAWHEPSEMMFEELVWTTDILGLCYLDAMEAPEIKKLDLEISVRALKHPKVTILFGDKIPAKEFKATIAAYEGRMDKF